MEHKDDDASCSRKPPHSERHLRLKNKENIGGLSAQWYCDARRWLNFEGWKKKGGQLFEEKEKEWDANLFIGGYRKTKCVDFFNHSFG